MVMREGDDEDGEEVVRVAEAEGGEDGEDTFTTAFCSTPVHPSFVPSAIRSTATAMRMAMNWLPLNARFIHVDIVQLESSEEEGSEAR